MTDPGSASRNTLADDEQVIERHLRRRARPDDEITHEDVRAGLLASSRCIVCLTKLAVKLHAPSSEVERARGGFESSRQRGTRTDTRYCSNACRQKAYRDRKQAA